LILTPVGWRAVTGGAITARTARVAVTRAITKPYVAIHGLGTRRAVVGRLGATTSGRAAVDVVASTSTVGAHQREESSNNIVNVWKLESSSADDNGDEETVELGESHLSLLKYCLTARHLHIKPRDDN
jgi:hypothetical protein